MNDPTVETFFAFLNEAKMARQFVGPLPRAVFAVDEERVYAVAYALRCAGQAAAGIGPAVRVRFSCVAWDAFDQPRGMFDQGALRLSPTELWDFVQTYILVSLAQSTP